MRHFNRPLTLIFTAALTSLHANAQLPDSAAAEESGNVIDAADIGRDVVVRGPLGVPLGRMIDIVATFEGVQSKGNPKLRVERMNGRRLDPPVSIEYVWFRASDKTEFSTDETIRLRGYQSGRFIGSPASTDPSAIQGDNFGFVTSFVIARNMNAAGPGEQAEMKMLIEKLALENDDTFLEQGSKFIKRESSLRINKSIETLANLGRPAWPVLTASFSDRRPSVAVQPTSGGHTVGVLCMHIVRKQILNLPKGYPATRTRPGKDGTVHASPGFAWGFHPTLSQWLYARRDKSLSQIQVDVLEQLISEEDRIGYSNDSEKAQIRGLLIQQLNHLKQSPPITRKGATP